MLEHYFTKPETADRIKESWIGESIEKYVIWLFDQGYAARTVHKHVPLLRRFGEVAWDLGARELKELPDHVDSFIDTWMREHKRRAIKKRSRSSIRKDIRSPVEQFLKIVVNGNTGN